MPKMGIGQAAILVGGSEYPMLLPLQRSLEQRLVDQLATGVSHHEVVALFRSIFSSRS